MFQKLCVKQATQNTGAAIVHTVVFVLLSLVGSSPGLRDALVESCCMREVITFTGFPFLKDEPPMLHLDPQQQGRRLLSETEISS
jgi:hypothetical protein